MRYYFENHGNGAKCVRKLCTDFRRREALLTSHVRYLMKKVKETGILIDKPNREKPKIVRTPENIAALWQKVCVRRLQTSIHCHYQQMNISKTSLTRILHKDLGIKSHKVQLVQKLKPIDHPMRFRFVKWACDRLTEDTMAKTSDEVHFNLGGFEKKQNCSICVTNARIH